jgi:hypothetical protein
VQPTSGLRKRAARAIVGFASRIGQKRPGHLAFGSDYEDRRALVTGILHAIRRLLDPTSPSRPTHVVPIGLSCRVSYQVRSYFGSSIAYPFDWWLTPIDSLNSYLSDPDPDRVYGAGALDEVVVDGHVTSVVAPEFGFLLYHEFPREDAGLPTRVVAQGWRDHVPEQRARHARRLERLLALNRPGRRILFVRDRLDVDGKGAETATESVAKLWSILSNHWSRAEIELLLVNVPCDARIAHPCVRWVDFEDVREDSPEGWRGSSAGWVRAFASREAPTSSP